MPGALTRKGRDTKDFHVHRRSQARTQREMSLANGKTKKKPHLLPP